jgi:hypothetical protein
MREIILSVTFAVLTLCASVSAEEVFFGALVEPPAGRVINGWGQFTSAWDLAQPGGKGEADDLAAYERAVAPHTPAMISFDVGPDFTMVSGFMNHFREFAGPRGFFIAQVAINFRGLEHDVSIGMRDPDLMVLADGLHNLGHPSLVAIGAGFNASGRLYEPSGYIGSFRHATDIMRKAHMNCAMIWEATARGLANSPYLKWYPGDDVVDWWGLEFADAGEFSAAESKAFVEAAVRHRKPVVISAAVPNAKSETEALKWCGAIFDFIRANPAIKAVSLRWPAKRLARWPKVATYVKQQLADPSFIDATEAPALFRPPRDLQPND